MIRLLIDESFDHRILRGLKSRLPELDFVLVRDIGLAASADMTLLRWAAQNDRIILTHDINTLKPDAQQLVQEGEPMAGVIVVPDRRAIGVAIRHLERLVVELSLADIRDQIRHVPKK